MSAVLGQSLCASIFTGATAGVFSGVAAYSFSCYINKQAITIHGVRMAAMYGFIGGAIGGTIFGFVGVQDDVLILMTAGALGGGVANAGVQCAQLYYGDRDNFFCAWNCVEAAIQGGLHACVMASTLEESAVRHRSDLVSTA